MGTPYFANSWARAGPICCSFLRKHAKLQQAGQGLLAPSIQVSNPFPVVCPHLAFEAGSRQNGVESVDAR